MDSICKWRMELAILPPSHVLLGRYGELFYTLYCKYIHGGVQQYYDITNSWIAIIRLFSNKIFIVSNYFLCICCWYRFFLQINSTTHNRIDMILCLAYFGCLGWNMKYSFPLTLCCLILLNSSTTQICQGLYSQETRRKWWLASTLRTQSLSVSLISFPWNYSLTCLFSNSFF